MGLFKDCGCGCDGKKQEQKLMNSILAALVFFIIASPDTFRVMRKIIGKWVAGPNGCPTASGLAFHSVVFMFITWGLMNLKSEGYKAETAEPAPQEVIDEYEDEDEVEVEEDVEVETRATDEMGIITEEDVSFAMEADTLEPMGGMPPMKIAAPIRMADAPSPLPGMAEAQIGAFDSGAMYAPMDLSVDGDKPQQMMGGITASLNADLSVSCADGSRPIVR